MKNQLRLRATPRSKTGPLSTAAGLPRRCLVRYSAQFSSCWRRELSLPATGRGMKPSPRKRLRRRGRAASLSTMAVPVGNKVVFLSIRLEAALQRSPTIQLQLRRQRPTCLQKHSPVTISLKMLTRDNKKGDSEKIINELCVFHPIFF